MQFWKSWMRFLASHRPWRMWQKLITAGGKATLLHIIFQRHHIPFDEVLSKPKWAQVLMLESMQIQLKEEEKQRKKRQGIIEDEEGGE